jgi:phage terminase large subunit
LSSLRIEVPEKLLPLLYPKRYKGAYGGRGGAKSHFFAEQVICGALAGKRIVCLREVQNSIKESVKQLLTDKIIGFGVEHQFTILESEIRGPNDSQIIFKGLQSFNAANIKSLEGFDIAWVEEAQTLSQHSLDLLRPTIRKQGSELWFSWNPRYKTDAVDKFFRAGKADNAVSVMINWHDNPWFKDTPLYADMLADFEKDPDKAEHVWNGAYGSSQGAILAKWVGQAERDGRIHKDVVYDPEGMPIEVSADLGFRDTASFWYWQRVPGGFNVLKYDGDSGLDAEEWIPRIQENIRELGCKTVGKIWLPHDSRAKTFQSRHTTMEQFVRAFGVQHVGLVPQSKKLDQISAARTVIDRCAFNTELCETGLDGLRAWEFIYSEENGVFSREPNHNWASHPSDAFAYGCQAMQEFKAKDEAKPDIFSIKGQNNGKIQTIPLNDMWAETSKRVDRI